MPPLKAGAVNLMINMLVVPPFNLIGTTVQKILYDKVEKAILIVPFWPTQSWFSLLMSVLISSPARLPRHTDILSMPHTGDLQKQAKPSRVCSIRKPLVNKGLSQEASGVIIASWRPGTIRQYEFLKLFTVHFVITTTCLMRCL